MINFVVLKFFLVILPVCLNASRKSLNRVSNMVLCRMVENALAVIICHGTQDMKKVLILNAVSHVQMTKVKSVEEGGETVSTNNFLMKKKVVVVSHVFLLNSVQLIVLNGINALNLAIHLSTRTKIPFKVNVFC